MDEDIRHRTERSGVRLLNRIFIGLCICRDFYVHLRKNKGMAQKDFTNKPDFLTFIADKNWACFKTKDTFFVIV